MLLLNLRVRDDILMSLLRYDLKLNAIDYLNKNLDKWIERKKGTVYFNNPFARSTLNTTSFLPGSLANLLNIYTSICPRCPKVPMNLPHLRTAHKISVVDPIFLIKDLYSAANDPLNPTRLKKLWTATQVVNRQIKKVKEFLSNKFIY